MQVSECDMKAYSSCWPIEYGDISTYVRATVSECCTRNVSDKVAKRSVIP